MMISLTYKISLAKKKKKIYTSICSFNYAEACVFFIERFGVSCNLYFNIIKFLSNALGYY